MTWTPETIRTMTEMWSAGHSAAEIGAVLGTTRNAVIGKVHRLGLQRSDSAVQMASRVRDAMRREEESRRKAAAALERKLEAARRAVAATEPEPIAAPGEIVAGCKWIDGDPMTRDWRMCGQDRQSLSAWCPHHHARVYRAEPRVKRPHQRTISKFAVTRAGVAS